ncbi:MAG: hypothetical protein A3I05_06505 [Deltaproteobacteria bacterium RIFCSPLOWO2_02_FULL_44_10]|nr:MAG: hypothetical protein A3C46_06710 [Deltaproteobacteria bacterium RIFCSPHIGHO2_02_FULL_44_16]OGQ46687.1 MAG: hypothetical protein A3I05_06505 [Deltaproteobacteria bacterium RIFCSPLOWO2_02_FULL_44_10]
MSDILVELKDVVKHFPVKRGFFERHAAHVHAVNGVSLRIRKGETLGLVGESGCGKSTLGLLLLRLLKLDSGQIFFEGEEITHLPESKMRPLRRQIQVVFQDPYASLNPRMKVSALLEEPLIIHRVGNKKERLDRVDELLSLVGLSSDAKEKYPHEFSGGQRQRVCIARALALKPKLIIADEPVSALDVSIRGQIVNLLMELQEKLGLSLLLISHDLTVVQHMSHRIAVMYLGKMMELFPSDQMSMVRHPYTQALISAIPIPEPGAKKKRLVLAGDVPSPISPPSGCPFHPRCPYAEHQCKVNVPALLLKNRETLAACHLYDTIPLLKMGGEV